MASDFTIKYRQFLPGGGFDSTGAPVQGKTKIVGSVSVTSYARPEALSPTDVGLTTIDSIQLRVGNQSGHPSASNRREALYNQASDQFYLITISSVGAVLEYAAAATETVEFEVFGDSAHNVELL